jgi:hypothetical protein
MDVNFLKNISEAYIIDTELKLSSEIIFEELYNLVKELRECDIDLYNELYSKDKVYQQQVLKEFLDLKFVKTEEVELTEFEIASISAVSLVPLITMLFGKNIVKSVLSVASRISVYFEKFGKFLAKQSKYLQLRYAMIYKSTSKCYAKCHIGRSTNDIKLFTPFSIKTKTGISVGGSLEQGQCLRECYIDQLIDLIALHMESYFSCLKLTGGYSTIKDSDADDIMRLVSSTNISAMCQDYYKAAKDALDNFYTVLDLVYEKHVDDDKKMKRINDLRSRIYSAKQEIQKNPDKIIQQRYNPSFNKK